VAFFNSLLGDKILELVPLAKGPATPWQRAGCPRP
jgi:hypothetical protein